MSCGAGNSRLDGNDGDIWFQYCWSGGARYSRFGDVLSWELSLMSQMTWWQSEINISELNKKISPSAGSAVTTNVLSLSVFFAAYLSFWSWSFRFIAFEAYFYRDEACKNKGVNHNSNVTTIFPKSRNQTLKFHKFLSSHCLNHVLTNFWTFEFYIKDLAFSGSKTWFYPELELQNTSSCPVGLDCSGPHPCNCVNKL